MLKLPKNPAIMHSLFKQIHCTSSVSEIIFPEGGHLMDDLNVTNQ